jgi:hypothetical protein
MHLHHAASRRRNLRAKAAIAAGLAIALLTGAGAALAQQKTLLDVGASGTLL